MQQNLSATESFASPTTSYCGIIIASVPAFSTNIIFTWKLPCVWKFSLQTLQSLWCFMLLSPSSLSFPTHFLWEAFNNLSNITSWPYMSFLSTQHTLPPQFLTSTKDETCHSAVASRTRNVSRWPWGTCFPLSFHSLQSLTEHLMLGRTFKNLC